MNAIFLIAPIASALTAIVVTATTAQKTAPHRVFSTFAVSVLGATFLLGLIAEFPIARGLEIGLPAEIALTLSLIGAVAIVAIEQPRRKASETTGHHPLTSSHLERRSAWTYAPRFLLIVWLSSVVMTILILAIVSVTTSSSAVGNNVLELPFGELRVGIGFLGWGHSWPILVAATVQLVAGVAALQWDARTHGPMRIPPYQAPFRRSSGTTTAILGAGALWGLAEIAEQVGFAALTQASVEGPPELTAGTPFAAAAVPLLIAAGIGSGAAVGLLLGRGIALLRSPRDG